MPGSFKLHVPLRGRSARYLLSQRRQAGQRVRREFASGNKPDLSNGNPPFQFAGTRNQHRGADARNACRC